MAAADEEGFEGADESQRLDKWLWFARVSKSRTLAAQLVVDGKVRVNRVRASKASQTVRRGDVLTIAQRGRVQVFKVLAPGVRRGPAPEARRLYEALTSEQPSGADEGQVSHRERGVTRPTKRERRMLDRLTKQD
jgi:ribosomal 50S subunit-recycling heat shock protein